MSILLREKDLNRTVRNAFGSSCYGRFVNIADASCLVTERNSIMPKVWRIPPFSPAALPFDFRRGWMRLFQYLPH
ncbi:hypothetical protein NEIPOLOT_02173 [Neisseria polysaccharea ATCC 43768]|nr:hypothetical protein NEIPOLOT_02173 [Neisseria polysaccharea ATCC 43768]